jgi:branched-subunit amino acid ABC-type transport system permease component
MGLHILIGVVNGSIYALLALGVLLMYQTTGVLNFAFGAFGMMAAYLFYWLADPTKGQGMNTVIAFFLVLIIAVPAGALIGRITLPAQRLSRIVKAAAALGLFSAIQGMVLILFPAEARSTPALSSDVAFRLFDIAVTWQRVIAIGVAVGGSALMLAFFRYSTLGSALRAMATSTETSTLVGLPIRRLWIVAWTISTFVAALAILVILPDLGMSVGSLSFVIFTPLAAVLAARFTSIPIALGSAFALGILQAIFDGSATLAPYRDTLPFLIVITALVLQPAKGTYERV